MRGQATISGIEGYWVNVTVRPLRLHGVADDYFLLYLKEVEYCFNPRDWDHEAFVNHLLRRAFLS